MKRQFSLLLILALFITMIPTSLAEVFAASAGGNRIDESYVTEDDGWVKVDDNTWTYTFDVEDTSLNWYAYESEVPDGYYTITTEDAPTRIENNETEIRNTGQEYSITFDPNGGKYEGSPISVTKRVNMYSKTNNTPGTAIKTGYAFDGWFVGDVMVFDEEGNAVDGDYWQGSGENAVWKNKGNVTVTAQYSDSAYAISYVLNGGQLGASHPSGGKYDTAVKIDPPTRRGYAFMGWTVEGMDDITHKYGTSASSYIETNATSLTAEETLGKTWYKDLREREGTVVFTANWKANVYSIAYAGIENATLEDPVTETKVDDPFVVNAPVRPGWTFDGWDITGMDDFTHLIGDEETNETSVTGTKATSFKNLRSEPGNITFTAKWTENVGTLTYNSNGKGRSPSPVKMKYPDEVKLESIDYVKGYHLKEWNTKADGTGESYLPKKVFKESNVEPFDITLYAIWEENTAVISYDDNSDDEELTVPKSAVMKYTAEYKIPTTKPTRTGYKFKEWNTGRKGGGKGYQPGAVFKAANEEPQETTLYAIWTEDEATVTYNANGRGTAPNPVTIYFSKQYNAEGAISADGWVFKGWNTKANGSGTMYQPNAVIKKAKVKPTNLTLYAIWARETHTLTVYGNGGTPNSKTYTMIVNASDNTRIDLPTKNGEECAGLYTRKVGGNMVYDADGKAVDGTYFKDGVFIYKSNFVLYAQYGTSRVPCVVYDKGCDDEVENIPANETKFIGKPISLSSLIPTRKGYNFVCWSTSLDITEGDCYYTQDGNGAVFPAVSDDKYGNYENGPITLYAIWQQTKEEDIPKAKLPVKYNFYSSDVKNGLLDAEITYKYRNFFRQQKEITVRRTIFSDTSQSVKPDVIIAIPSWHTGDEIPGLEGLEPLKPIIGQNNPDDPEEQKNVVVVSTEEELNNAINSWNYAEDGVLNLRVGSDIEISEPAVIPFGSAVSIDLDGKALKALSNGKSETKTYKVPDGALMPTSILLHTEENVTSLLLLDGENAINPKDYNSIYICNDAGERLTGDLKSERIESGVISITDLDLPETYRVEINGHLSDPVNTSSDAVSLAFSEWEKEESETIVTPDTSVAFKVLGDLYITNGTVSAGAKCVSLDSMAELLAEKVEFKDASYAVYFEKGNGSAISELDGATVRTAVICGTENEHSILTFKGDSKAYSNGIYADFTGKNTKGFVVEASYFVKDPSVYVNPKSFTVEETSGDFNYRVRDNNDLGSRIIEGEANDVLMGYINGLGEYPDGGTVTLEAVANEHAEFVAWKDSNGKVLSKNAEWTFKISSDMNVVAEFRWIPHTITGVCDEKMGTVDGSGEYGESQTAKLIAKANDNYDFSHWEDSEGDEVGTEPTLEVVVEGDATYRAVFEPIGITLTLDIPGILDESDGVIDEEPIEEEPTEEPSDEESDDEEEEEEVYSGAINVTVNGKPIPKTCVVKAKYGEQLTVFAGTEVEGYSVLGFYDADEEKYVAKGSYYEFDIEENTSLSIVLDVSDEKASELIASFKEEQEDRIRSEFISYSEEFLNKVQPVGSIYTTTDPSLGKGEHYEDENYTETREDEEGNEYEFKPYHVDLGLEKIEAMFGGEWERVENTFLYADGDEELGTMGGKMKYKLSAAMNVDSNNISYVLENKSDYMNQSLENIIKMKFSPVTATPSNGVVAYEALQKERATTVMPPYQSVYVFRRVS